MKKTTNKNVWLVILAITLVFGMTVVGCNDDTEDRKSPEEKTTAERWYVWTADDTTAKVTHSVDEDGVCTVTVGGTADVLKWKASPRYEYTSKKDTAFAYKFEAWTQSGYRELNIQYYDGINGSGEGPYLGQYLEIDNTRKTYTVEGVHLPLTGVASLQFQCADQLGTFYVKIISITEIKISSLTITGIPYDYWGTVDIYDSDDDVAYGQNSILNGKVIFYLNDGNGSRWNKTGKYIIILGIWEEDFNFGRQYLYTGGKELNPDGDVTQFRYTFTANSQHTINFNQFKLLIDWEDNNGEDSIDPPPPIDLGE
jgi:hypothetical protein